MAQDYREYLRIGYQKRRSLNQAYTLRAFARDLQISPSTLSEIMAGKKGLSPARAEVISVRLNLDEPMRLSFMALVEKKYSRRKKIDRTRSNYLKELLKKTAETRQRSLIASAMSHWASFAILELTHIRGFKAEISWVAEALGLTKKETNLCVQQLISAGLLEIEGGRWLDQSEVLATTDGIPSASVRELNVQLLEKAKWAVNTLSVDQRTSQSLVFSISKDKLPDFREKLYRLRDEYVAMCESFEEKDQVYCALFHLFPLSGEEESRSK